MKLAALSFAPRQLLLFLRGQCCVRASSCLINDMCVRECVQVREGGSKGWEEGKSG